MAKSRMTLRDLMQAVTVGYFGYEAMQKMLNYEAFAAWCNGLPYLGEIGPVLAFVVVAIEVLIAILVPFGRPRMAMILTVVCSIAFTVYHCIALSADWFYLPFHQYWPGMTWLSRMLITLAIAWIGWWWLRSAASQKKSEVRSY